MRSMLGLVFLGSLVLGGCSGAEGGGLRRTAGGTPAEGSGETTTTQPTTNAPSPSTAIACPSDVPSPKQLSAAPDVADVRFSNGDVIYRDGTKVLRTKKDGTGTTELYANDLLVRSYADDTSIVTIEETAGDPAAVIKITPSGAAGSAGGKLGDGPTLTFTPGWNAAGSYVFASDTDSLFFLADVPNQGDTIYKVSKQGLTMQLLAQLGAPLTDPLLAGNDVWFVRDGRRIYKVAQLEADDAAPGLGLPGTAGPPQEVFAMGYAACRLAVGGNKAYCSTGAALETRDLSGANVATVLEGAKAKAPFMLGPATYTDTLFLRTLPSTQTDPLKHGIRAVKVDGASAAEKTIACGREAIGSFVADASIVVWAEKGKGLFSAPR